MKTQKKKLLRNHRTAFIPYKLDQNGSTRNHGGNARERQIDPSITKVKGKRRITKIVKDPQSEREDGDVLDGLNL